MAHKHQREFCEQVKRQFPFHFESTHTRVLEIGSRNVNGTVRDLFATKNYTGLDLTEGKDVDVVCHVREFLSPDNHFDVVISCEALEHDREWKETLLAAYRLLKPGGLLVITCAGPNRAEHGTTRTTPRDSPATTDYYMNLSPTDILEAFGVHDKEFVNYAAAPGWDGKDTYFWGVKK